MRSNDAIRSSRFEYCMNALHFCLWVRMTRSWRKTGKLIDRIFIRITKCLPVSMPGDGCSKRKLQGETEKILYSQDDGVAIWAANHWFGYLYSCYTSLISFPLFGVAFRYKIHLDSFRILLLVTVPVLLAYVPLYMAVFYKDNYKKYYNQFADADAKWLKEWNRKLLIFVFGALLSVCVGIVSGFMIAKL